MSSSSNNKQQTAVVAAASALAGALVAAGLFSFFSRRKQAQTNVYETQRSLSEYLLFHYGSASELLQWSFGPTNSLTFPADLSTRAIEFCLQQRGWKPESCSRALDIGCAVGRTSFELSRTFASVIGIDYSHSFIDAACQLAAGKSLAYQRFDEGDVSTPLVASAPAGANANRIHFEQGDACNLRADLGEFDLVIAANLICRLPDARPFLVRLAQLVRSGGVLFLTTPFSWLEQFTPKSTWLGGKYAADGEAIDSFTTLTALLSENFTLEHTIEMPFFIREHARKNQWSVAKGSFWVRK